MLRQAFPEHRVSRLDVCLDMRGEAVFEDVVRLMSQVGREYRLKGEKIIPDDLDDGSTYYLGSRSSPLRVRCYEKGKQLYKFTGDKVWKMFFDWTRLELQVRPEKAFKSEAATMAPEAFWGCSAWTRDLANGALAMNPEPVTMKPTRIADHERAMRALTAQYGATILRQVGKVGGWEEFLADLKQRLGVDLQDAA
jgi:DNA relaxase NicK